MKVFDIVYDKKNLNEYYVVSIPYTKNNIRYIGIKSKPLSPITEIETSLLYTKEEYIEIIRESKINIILDATSIF